MGRLLDEVIAEASKLRETERESFAKWALAELESERRWDELFAESQDMLATMAEEALGEHRAGRTLPLNPDEL